MKLISTRYSRPEELSSAYPAEVAAELVRNALEYRENIDGLDQLRMDHFLSSVSEAVEWVESGEWLLMKDEAYMFDWSVFAKRVRADKLEPLMLQMMRNPPVQEVRCGEIFQVVDSITGKPISNRKYIATVGGERVNGQTDARGTAYIAAPKGAKISIHFVFHAPTGEIEDFMESVNG